MFKIKLNGFGLFYINKKYEREREKKIQNA